MKRFHVHVSVENLDDSIGFYSKLFGTAPAVVKPDYAKWMLDDPRVNFAISRRGHAPGVNHLGFQVDSDAELSLLRDRVAQAGLGAVDDAAAACCYAKSDKYWLQDPQGLAWETFHTLGDIPVFGKDTAAPAADSACCVPLAQQPQDQPESACCVPAANAATGGKSACCG